MDRFRDIINKIHEIPSVPPPDDFTQGVMLRIDAAGRRSISVKLGGYVARSRGLDTLRDVIARNIKGTECPLSFFVTGLFYMIMGIVLMVGLKGIGGDDTIIQLVRFQTQITLVSSILLIVLGLMMASDGLYSIKAGKFGLMIYVCLVIVNGLVLQTAFRVSIADIFTVIFAGAGLIMGIFLASKIDDYQKQIMRRGA